MPEVRALGFGTESRGSLSHAQARMLVRAQEMPELRIVIARQGLEPALEITPQHGHAADDSGVGRKMIERYRHIIEWRGTHEVLPESGSNSPSPDAVLASALRTQVDKSNIF